MADTRPTVSHVRDSVARIVQNDPDVAPDLFYVITSVMDARGDPAKYAFGCVALRELFMLTPEFEAAFNRYLDVPVVAACAGVASPRFS